MTDHVYQSSMFWFLVQKAAEFAYFFGPWLVLLGTMVWAYRFKSWPAYLALVGGILMAGAHFSHLTTVEVHTISLGGMQPVVGQNPVVVFFYIYGFRLGPAILGVALLAQFLRKPTVA